MTRPNWVDDAGCKHCRWNGKESPNVKYLCGAMGGQCHVAYHSRHTCDFSDECNRTPSDYRKRMTRKFHDDWNRSK